MAETATSSPAAPGEVVSGKYRVERLLGVGGMGVVVAARDLLLDRLVALKFVKPEFVQRPMLTERFLREGRAAAQLKSQHVALVHEVGVHTIGATQVPYLALEYLEGTDLKQLRLCGSITADEAVSYVVQACDALAEAHELGITHRDIKPDNLFLAHRPNRPAIIKVLDFGISRSSEREGEPRLTGDAGLLGTPAYMAPEHMKNARNANARSDIWSLGAVLYELIMGRLPFAGSNVAELCAAILTTQPEPIVRSRPEIHPDLEAVVMRCLEKDPARRFATAVELAAALAPFDLSSNRQPAYRSGAHAAAGVAWEPSDAANRATTQDLDWSDDEATRRANAPSETEAPEAQVGVPRWTQTARLPVAQHDRARSLPADARPVVPKPPAAAQGTTDFTAHSAGAAPPPAPRRLALVAAVVGIATVVALVVWLGFGRVAPEPHAQGSGATAAATASAVAPAQPAPDDAASATATPAQPAITPSQSAAVASPPKPPLTQAPPATPSPKGVQPARKQPTDDDFSTRRK